MLSFISIILNLIFMTNYFLNIISINSSVFSLIFSSLIIFHFSLNISLIYRFHHLQNKPFRQIMYCCTIMDYIVYATETASSSFIAAIGIHIISGSKLPKSSGIIALNSLVLLVYEMDVTQAPTQGLLPLW